jgi:hypothetical protein
MVFVGICVRIADAFPGIVRVSVIYELIHKFHWEKRIKSRLGELGFAASQAACAQCGGSSAACIGVAGGREMHPRRRQQCDWDGLPAGSSKQSSVSSIKISVPFLDSIYWGL